MGEIVQRIILVESAQIVERGAELFPGAQVALANGSLPEGATAFPDAVVTGNEPERLQSLCAALQAAGCASIRLWQIDLSEFTSRQQVLDAAGGIRPYVPIPAPQPDATPSDALPSSEATAAGAGSDEAGKALQVDVTDEDMKEAIADSVDSDPEADYEQDIDEDAEEVFMRSMRNSSANKTAAHKEARAPSDWPDPVNFWSASALPAFDARWIIQTMRPFVLNQAAMVGCDPGIPWLQTIAFAAGCLSDDIRVRVRPSQDWAESARIWACIVGDSGDGKSPAMRGIMREARDMNIEIAERSKHRQSEYKDEFDLYELERKEWLQRRKNMDAAKPAGLRPIAPIKPVNEMLYFNDTTSEGLNDQQEATTRGAMCYSDEFLGWLLGMDQYKAGGKGSDRQFWLSSWDGAEYVGIRAGKLRTIPNTGVTIVGGSQPGAIRMAATKLNLDSDGLIQRVLVYNSSGEASEGAEQPADRQSILRWRSILAHLYNMKPHLDPCVFSEHAHVVRNQSNEWIKAMREVTSLPVAARQALSKWRAYLPRIALTFHAIEAADNGLEVIPATIEDHSIETAWEYMRECLWPHLLHFYSMLNENAEDRQHLIAFANYVLARDLLEVRPAYLSSKWTHYQRKIKTIQQRREFWDSVVQAGWARPSGGFDRTGQIASSYEINPCVFEVFAGPASIAKAQIEKYREIMHPSFAHREPGED